MACGASGAILCSGSCSAASVSPTPSFNSPSATIFSASCRRSTVRPLSGCARPGAIPSSGSTVPRSRSGTCRPTPSILRSGPAPCLRWKAVAGIFNLLVVTFPLSVLAAVLFLINWDGHHAVLWRALHKRFGVSGSAVHGGIVICALARRRQAPALCRAAAHAAFSFAGLGGGNLVPMGACGRMALVPL